MKMLALFPIWLALTLLSGCISVKAYVDPRYHRAGYEAIQRPAKPIPLKLVPEFRRNGQRFPAGDQEARGHLERTLRATGVFEPGGGVTASAKLHVVINNIADVASAGAKGLGTGLTLGAVGSMVDDNYELTFEYTRADGSATKSIYHHAIHSLVGGGDGPPELTPTTVADAFARVVEDATLNFLKDLQSSKKGL